MWMLKPGTAEIKNLIHAMAQGQSVLLHDSDVFPASSHDPLFLVCILGQLVQ